MEIKNRMSGDYLLKLVEKLLLTENSPSRIIDKDKIVFKKLGYSELFLFLPSLSSRSKEDIELHTFEFIKKSEYFQNDEEPVSTTTNLIFETKARFEPINFFENLNNCNKERIINFLEGKVVEYS